MSRRRNAPTRGEWQSAEGVGWQHGEIPKPPSGLRAASREAWDTWFRAWFAWFWLPSDLPALRVLVRLYDAVERGEFQRAGEMRLWLDGYGITPKGRQDRRIRPLASDAHAEVRPSVGGGYYGHLRVVEEEPPAVD